MPNDTQIAHSHSRNQSLDALRGLAATLVLVTHASETYAPVAQRYGYSTWLAQAVLSIDIGRIGVVIFFLISGFAVANSLRQSANGMGGFVIRRAVRLYPMFWLSVVIAAVFLQPAPWPGYSVMFANLTMMPEFIGFKQMMGIYWTLETEVVSYSLAVLLVVVGQYNSVRSLGLICAALVLIFALMMFGVLPSARLLQWQMLPHNLAIILWASLFHLSFSTPIADARTQRPTRVLHRPVTLLLAILVVSPSFYMLLQYVLHGGHDQLRWGFAYPAAFSIFLLTYFNCKGVSRWMVWLGKISYSSYLLHSFVVILLCNLLERYVVVQDWVSLPLFVALSLMVTTALASVTFVVIEKPAMQWGKKLEQRHREKLLRESALTL